MGSFLVAGNYGIFQIEIVKPIRSIFTNIPYLLESLKFFSANKPFLEQQARDFSLVVLLFINYKKQQ